jgi:putative heme-binding domain-containing protein
MLANDPWFRGIAIKYGPDGGVFVSDWTDTGECHNYKEVDRSNGRIFKITYGKPKLWNGDLSKMSDLELVKLQEHKNEWQVRHARRLLQERASALKLQAGVGDKLRTLLESANASVRLRALWALYAINQAGLLTFDPIIEKDKDERMRAWAVRLFSEQGFPSPLVKFILAEKAAKDRSPIVRLALASSIRHHNSGWDVDREAIFRSVTENAENASDPTLSLMIWYGIEPLAAKFPKHAMDLLADTKLPLVQEFLTRRLLSLPGQPLELLEPILNVLSRAGAEAQLPILKGIQAAVVGQRQIKMPAGWPDAYAKLSINPSAEVRDRASRLAVVFGDKNALEALTRVVRDSTTTTATRYDALQALLFQQTPELQTLLRDLLDDKAMRGSAIRALAGFKNDETPAQLLAIYPKLTESEKNDVVQTLASRPAWALKLLDAVESKQVPRADVSVFIARQMQVSKDKQVQEKLARVWGQIKPASKEKAELMAKFKKSLTPDILKAADLSKGRLVFAKNCASCHRLYDDGGNIGPNLTGSQRGNLDYVLENVLDPSAVVAKEYQMSRIETAGGRNINGIIKQETDKALTIQTPNEVIVLPKDEIESRSLSPLSMMPEGIFDKLSPREIRDLVAYLAGKDQVPLAK